MDILTECIQALSSLPGIGSKSAQRMVYQLLRYQRKRAIHLARCLQKAMECLTTCEQCNNYTENTYCPLCEDPTRDPSILCIVENPWDIAAIEQSHVFSGRYFVLMGKISPLDGLGPEEIGLPKLFTHVQKNPIKEVIIALTPSIETQTTLFFIHDLLKKTNVQISHLAHGIPSDSQLEFLDPGTIASALQNRAIQHV